MTFESFAWLFEKAMVPFTAAFLGAGLASRFGFRRYKKEWWWQRKAAAYQDLLLALHKAGLYSTEHFEAMVENREVGEGRRDELLRKAKAGLEAIARAREVGGFLLSNKAIERLRIYEQQVAEARNTADWFEHLDKDMAATARCLEDLIAIAKSDLGG